MRQRSPAAARTDKPAHRIGRERVAHGADEIAGVRLTHPDRVLYEPQGITKRRLAEYYVAIADRMLPYVAGRPLSLVRCPDGAGKDCFYQKHVMRGMPDAIRPVPIRDSRGMGDYVSIADAAGLVALVQFGVLEIHPWNARVEDVEAADQLVIDLDPAPDVEWKTMIDAAREVKDRLAQAGLASFLKVTGGKGLHVVAPLRPAVGWALAKEFTRALATRMAADSPDTYIAKSSKAARRGLIFVDYLRNDRGATAIAPYSTRARPGAPVAMPLAWPALNARLKPDQFSIDDAVRSKATPWKDFFDLEQTIDGRSTKALT